MFTLLVFAGGVTLGVVYQKSLNAWKNKALRAAEAAKNSFQQQ